MLEDKCQMSEPERRPERSNRGLAENNGRIPSMGTTRHRGWFNAVPWMTPLVGLCAFAMALCKGKQSGETWVAFSMPALAWWIGLTITLAVPLIFAVRTRRKLNFLAFVSAVLFLAFAGMWARSHRRGGFF